MEKDFYSEYFRIEDKHWWFVGRRRLLLRVIDKLVRSRPGRLQILDLGCGTGTMLQYLARFGDAQGADADEEAVRFCHLRGVGRVTRLQGEVLPFPDRTFDLVTMLDVLEHIEDDAHMLREVRRILREDGFLVMTVPAFKFLWGAQDEISHHKRRYRSSEVRSRVEGAGFRVKRLSYFNSLLFPPAAAIRLLRRFRPGKRESGQIKSDFTMTEPGRLNEILATVFSIESLLISRMNFPFGISILAVAQRPSLPEESV